MFWKKGVFKNNYSECCQVEPPGKILEKIPMKNIIFSKTAGLSARKRFKQIENVNKKSSAGIRSGRQGIRIAHF